LVKRAAWVRISHAVNHVNGRLHKKNYAEDIDMTETMCYTVSTVQSYACPYNVLYNDSLSEVVQYQFNHFACVSHSVRFVSFQLLKCSCSVDCLEMSCTAGTWNSFRVDSII